MAQIFVGILPKVAQVHFSIHIVWVYTIFAYFHTIDSLYLLYVFSWTITAVAEILYFAKSYRKLAATL